MLERLELHDRDVPELHLGHVGRDCDRREQRHLALHARRQRQPHQRPHVHRPGPGDRRDHERQHVGRPERGHVRVRHLCPDRLDHLPDEQRALQRHRLGRGDDRRQLERRGCLRHDGQGLDPEGRQQQPVLGRHRRRRPLRSLVPELRFREQRHSERRIDRELVEDAQRRLACRRLDLRDLGPDHRHRDEPEQH